MSEQAKNLHQRILAVMAAVPYVQKDATVQAGGGQSYKGVTHDAVAAKLRKPMIEHGIVMKVTQSAEHVVEGQTRSGTPKIRYEAWYDVTLYNADKPEESMTYQVHAHAEDGGDKAPGKAMSYATKMALLKAFMLETGESDESRYQPDEIAYITTDQAEDIRQWIEDTGTDEAKFLGWIKADSIESIPANSYKRALNALKKKAEKGGS